MDWNRTDVRDWFKLQRSLPLRGCGLKWFWNRQILQNGIVTPLAGVWIEIEKTQSSIKNLHNVTPLAGVWIEIASGGSFFIMPASLPLRGCGLKWNTPYNATSLYCHSPCGGVDWNTVINDCVASCDIVTPLAGVWIEILLVWPDTYGQVSLPLRGCGLK